MNLIDQGWKVSTLSEISYWPELCGAVSALTVRGCWDYIETGGMWYPVTGEIDWKIVCSAHHAWPFTVSLVLPPPLERYFIGVSQSTTDPWPLCVCVSDLLSAQRAPGETADGQQRRAGEDPGGWWLKDTPQIVAWYRNVFFKIIFSCNTLD